MRSLTFSSRPGCPRCLKYQDVPKLWSFWVIWKPRERFQSWDIRVYFISFQLDHTVEHAFYEICKICEIVKKLTTLAVAENLSVFPGHLFLEQPVAVLPLRQPFPTIWAVRSCYAAFASSIWIWPRHYKSRFFIPGFCHKIWSLTTHPWIS